VTAEPTTGDIRLGTPFPLGATPLQEGVNFAVFAGSADAVDLCLFDEAGHERRIRLPGLTHGIHHGQIGGMAAGQAYGFRAHGRWEPAAGMRANPAKLLIDPYAKAIAGDVRWDATVFGHRQSDPRTRSLRDDAAAVPRSIVVGDRFDWGDDAPPSTPLEDSVVYEAHVKGMTMRHPDVPAELRGSYAGLACPPILDHLRQLGVTAIELLPVHQFITEHHLAERRLTNYWGYNSIGFFAPHGAYSSSGDRGEQVGEFKAMVKAFHEAGIEVLLDVVYNHTAEGNDLGGTFSFKGLDNAAYYVLADDRSRYVDHTGTGNSLDLGHPETLRLVMDSLRYWVDEMHVDGFRFDLATALAVAPRASTRAPRSSLSSGRTRPSGGSS